MKAHHGTLALLFSFACTSTNCGGTANPDGTTHTGGSTAIGGATDSAGSAASSPADAGGPTSSSGRVTLPVMLRGGFDPTGSMSTARADHTATLLPNGKVLVAGGSGLGGASLASAEQYDPAARTFTAIGSMTTARDVPTATLLPNGKVLIAGGYPGLASAELYDPATETFAATGSMTVPRVYQSATLLPSGKVLIAGGWYRDSAGTVQYLTSAELYDSASGRFTATGSLLTQAGNQATLLPNAMVLFTGDGSAELYDPATGTFTATGSLLTRGSSAPTLLQNGMVLLAGGSELIGTSVKNAQLYDPAAGTFIATGDMTAPRKYQTATLLPSGKVLVVGGENEDSTGGIDLLTSAELYDPAAGTFTATGSTTTTRTLHTATLLRDGTVLIAGGGAFADSVLASAELYTP